MDKSMDMEGISNFIMFTNSKMELSMKDTIKMGSCMVMAVSFQRGKTRMGK